MFLSGAGIGVLLGFAAGWAAKRYRVRAAIESLVGANPPPDPKLLSAVPELAWAAAIVQRLRDSEERYRILTDNIAAGIVLHDTNGVVSWCSPFTEVLTGFSRHEIQQNQESFLRSLVVEEDRELLERSFKIVATGEAFQFRYRFQHRSGLTMWAETRSVPIFDEQSGTTLVLSISLDVTSAVLYQHQIEEKNRDLHDFTYMVSHDLKAPINTIKGMLTVVEEDSAIPESAREPLEYVRRASYRLEQLVHGILQLARVTTLDTKQQQVDLKQLLDDVHQDYRQLLESSGARLDIEGELPAIVADPTQVYQILSNLIGNAIKYKSSDRSLIIRVSAEPGTTSRKATVIIEDNGLGIPELHLKNLFKPFKRAHETVAEGSGVGLACVKRLVEKLGGSISAVSDGKTGTRFEVELRKAR